MLCQRSVLLWFNGDPERVLHRRDSIVHINDLHNVYGDLLWILSGTKVLIKVNMTVRFLDSLGSP